LLIAAGRPLGAVPGESLHSLWPGGASDHRLRFSKIDIRPRTERGQSMRALLASFTAAPRKAKLQSMRGKSKPSPEEGNDMSFKEIDDAKAQVMKILGKDADLPKEKADFDKIMETINKDHENFNKVRDQLEAAVLDSENSLSALENAVKQTKAIYEKADFGLDPKRPDDAKKIKHAQQIFSAAFSAVQKNLATSTKNLDELDKHVIQMGKYKGPTV
jgi:hypothetical protein